MEYECGGGHQRHGNEWEACARARPPPVAQPRAQKECSATAAKFHPAALSIFLAFGSARGAWAERGVTSAGLHLGAGLPSERDLVLHAGRGRVQGGAGRRSGLPLEGQAGGQNIYVFPRGPKQMLSKASVWDQLCSRGHLKFLIRPNSVR
jgi:hypothetical protein